MEGEEADDSFGSLVKLCEPTASQEEILRNCPFAREFETFRDPDPNGMTSSSESWMSPEHPVVVMVSPQESHDGGSVDPNTTQDEDKYHTPPDHSLSLASDSDDPKKPPPPPEPTVLGGDDDPAQAVDLGDEEEDEENVGFRLDRKLKSSDGNLRGEQPPPPPPATTVSVGNDDLIVERAVKVEVEENQGVLESQLDRNLNGECCDCVIRDHEIEILEFVSDKKRGLEGEIFGNDWKKIRLCESYLNTEIVDLDSEECDEELGLDEQKVVISVDSAKKQLKEGDRIDKFVNLQEKGEDCGSGNKGENLFEAAEEGGGIIENEKMRGNGLIDEKVPENGSTGADVKGKEILCNDAKVGGRNGKFEKLGENGKGVDGNIEWGDLCKDGEGGGRNVEGRDLCKNGRGGDGISGAKRMRGNGEKGGVLRKDNSRKEGNGDGLDGVICGAEKSGNSGGRSLTKALLAIEKFKYVGSGGGLERSRKKGGVLGKQELPLSMTGQEKGVGEEVKGGNGGMKGGSFLDILDPLKSVLGDPDDGPEHDFLEMAQRSGIVFPRPRWWPPEGFD